MTIRLKNIRLYGYHGVYDGEKELGQRFEVDVEYEVLPEAKPQDDEASSTVDYTEVYRLIQEYVTQRRFNLIETLAGEIAGEMLRRFPLKEARVRVRKPSVPLGGILDYVEAEEVRRRNDEA